VHQSQQEKGEAQSPGCSAYSEIAVQPKGIRRYRDLQQQGQGADDSMRVHNNRSIDRINSNA
jgi:hypothetical protein